MTNKHKRTNTGKPAATRNGLKDPLLRTAAELFNKHRIQDVTVEHVARLANVKVEDALRRYPSSAYLVRGIYEAVLKEIPAKMAEQESLIPDLHNRLCAIVLVELQMLQPYKAFVKSSLIELVNPTSTQLLLQLPTMQKLLGYIADQIAVARAHGHVAWWVVPNVAAASFAVLHARIVAYWLTMDNRGGWHRTRSIVERDIRLFVRILQNPLGLVQAGRMMSGSQSLEWTIPQFVTAPTAGSASRKK